MTDLSFPRGSVLMLLILLTALPALGASGHDPEPERGRIVIHATGDVNFSHTHNARFRRDGYDVAWSGLRGIFERDHLTIVNLECIPSTLGSPIEKEWTFRCDLEALPVMLAAGVEVTGLANNHSGDFGRIALLDGIANLREAGFHPVGAGADLDEANVPALFEIEGWTVAVVGLSAIRGGAGWFAGPATPGVAPASLDNITRSVSAAARVADVVLVTVHWGEEGSPGPTSGDRQRARAMIDAGATAIFGHHPHRLQPLEIVDGVPVFWSLGNFVWPNLSVESSTTGIAELIVEPDGTVHARLIPAFIERHGEPVVRGLPDWTLREDRALMR